jgi:SAM-dependent methyltransferase
MPGNHRREYHRAWSRLTPPLRPHAEVVATVRQQIAGFSGRALLLGVTPELADVVSDLVAIDRNFSMVMNVWPGNTSSRWAVVGDWRNRNFAPGSFSLCLGDGSLCGLRYPDDIVLVLAEVARALRQGGRFICRLYLSPDQPETVWSIKEALLCGAIRNFHAFKFRLGMALAAHRPERSIAVAAILAEFDSSFSDRSELVRVTGWNREEIDTIDFYRESNVVFNFPTGEQVLKLAASLLCNVRLVPTGTYEMAERCPLLVAETT